MTQHELADVTALERARQHYDADRGDGDPKLTLGTLVAYACITTLRSFPTFNSHFDADSAEVKTSSRVHLGLAVDTERGLLVPVVENADRLSLRELALRMVDLAAKARAGELEAQELRGSTFTLTNLGGIGGRFFTPIVNPPEVAILGAGRAFLERDQEGDESVRLPLSLSYDHRVIDGAHGARFITAVAHKLRNALAVAL